MGEEIRRNSMVLDTLSSTLGDVSKTPKNTHPFDLSFGAFGLPVKESSNAPFVTQDDRGGPSAPPASQEDFYAMNRLLNDYKDMGTKDERENIKQVCSKNQT